MSHTNGRSPYLCSARQVIPTPSKKNTHRPPPSKKKVSLRPTKSSCFILRGWGSEMPIPASGFPDFCISDFGCGIPGVIDSGSRSPDSRISRFRFFGSRILRFRMSDSRIVYTRISDSRIPDFGFPIPIPGVGLPHCGFSDFGYFIPDSGFPVPIPEFLDSGFWIPDS